MSESNHLLSGVDRHCNFHEFLVQEWDTSFQTPGGGRFVRPLALVHVQCLDLSQPPRMIMIRLHIPKSEPLNAFSMFALFGYSLFILDDTGSNIFELDKPCQTTS